MNEYHRAQTLSLLCSEWEEVGHIRVDHQQVQCLVFLTMAEEQKIVFEYTTPLKGSVALKKIMFEWTISTSRLNALLRVHLTPINLVIFQGPKTPNLGKGFVLRCFQRLSLPNIATQRFSWYQSW